MGETHGVLFVALPTARPIRAVHPDDPVTPADKFRICLLQEPTELPELAHRLMGTKMSGLLCQLLDLVPAESIEIEGLGQVRHRRVKVAHGVECPYISREMRANPFAHIGPTRFRDRY
jgi:hypothetical protein